MESDLGLLGGVLGIILLGTLFYLFLATLFEIPEWSRSVQLSKIARKYNLTYKRAHKGWIQGWISLNAAQRNLISGSFGNMVIDFRDITLIEGNLDLGDKPSIAEVGSEWSLQDASGFTRTRSVSKINGVFYSQFTPKELSEMLEDIQTGKIKSPDEIRVVFGTKDFSKHFMRNYVTAAWISAIILLASLAIIALVDPGYSQNSLIALGIFTLGINLPIFLWLSKKYGKQFNPTDINKMPERLKSF